MEPLWSPVVATGGNQGQIAGRGEPRKQAKSVATGSHRLPEKFHGKEGGRRFESVRGLCKSPAKRGFAVCVQSAWGLLRAWMEPFMELSRRERARCFRRSRP